MRIRKSQPTSQPAAIAIKAGRLCEQTMISVIIAKYLHDAQILDVTDPAQQLGHLTVEILIDGEIPVRIDVQKECCGPAWIKWHLWPNEPGRRTWGTMSVGQLSAAKAILVLGHYDRACKRSPRLAKISLPDARRGRWSTEFKQFGIETTL